MTEPEIRRARIEELLLEEMETIVPLEMHDPRVVGSQVTRIHLSADMKSCRVFVIVRGSETEKTDALTALNHAASYVRGEISNSLGLKYTPRFHFVYDKPYEEAENVRQVMGELGSAKTTDQESTDE